MGTLNPLSLTLHIHIIHLQSVSPLKYFSDLYPNFSDPIVLTLSPVQPPRDSLPALSCLHHIHTPQGGERVGYLKSKPNSCSGLKPSPTGEVLGLKWNLRPLFLPTSCIPASHVMCGPLDPSTSYLSTWLPLSPLPAGFTPRTFHQLILLINTPGRPFFTSLPPQLLGPDYVRDPSFLLPEYLHLDSSLLHLLTNNSLKNTTLCKAQRPGAKPERREERGVPTRHRLLVSPGGTHREVFSLPCPPAPLGCEQKAQNTLSHHFTARLGTVSGDNLCFFLAIIHGIQDLSFQTRDQTHASCSGNTES